MSASSSYSIALLSRAQKGKVASMYNSIPQNEKWRLASQKVVEDEMAKLAATLTYEHPVHSLILDPEDTTWNEIFSEADLEEIRTYKRINLPNLPEDLQNCLDDFNAEEGLTTGAELLEYAREMKYNPILQPDLYWVERSTYDISHLFLGSATLTRERFFEADALHSLWAFCYTLYDYGMIQARVGERVSAAAATGSYMYGETQITAKRQRKAVDAKVDVLYRSGVSEVGCCQVGELESVLKMPKVLRDMLVALHRQKPGAVLEDLTTVGYSIIGTEIQLVMMDFPHNLYISRVTRLDNYHFPGAILGVASTLPALFDLAWKGKAVMVDTLNKLHRARVTVEFLREAARLPTFSFNKDA